MARSKGMSTSWLSHSVSVHSASQVLLLSSSTLRFWGPCTAPAAARLCECYEVGCAMLRTSWVSLLMLHT